jgi:hypothetical protein
MMAFRKHLRTDKNVRVTLGCLLERFSNGAAPLHTVAVNSIDPLIGKVFAECVLKPFSSFTERANHRSALGTGLVEWSGRATMVAPQNLVACVNCHARVAAIAFRDVSAAGTDECWREATTIKKNQRLPVVAEM